MGHVHPSSSLKSQLCDSSEITIKSHKRTNSIIFTSSYFIFITNDAYSIMVYIYIYHPAWNHLYHHLKYHPLSHIIHLNPLKTGLLRGMMLRSQPQGPRKVPQLQTPPPGRRRALDALEEASRLGVPKTLLGPARLSWCRVRWCPEIFVS